jgi:hypothetical protein
MCTQVMTAQPHLQHSQLQAALAKPLNLRWAAVLLAQQGLMADHDCCCCGYLVSGCSWIYTAAAVYCTCGSK